MTSSLFLYIIMFLILLSALIVVSSKDPIQAVLFLVLVFILTAVMLFLVGAEFLAVLLITVYVGAIAILFLFVVMLLNLRMVEVYSSFYYHIPIGSFIGLFFFSTLLFIFSENTVISSHHLFLNFNYYGLWTSYSFWSSNLSSLGETLYNYYADLFMLIGLILFVAMIGVIILTVDYDYRAKEMARSVNTADLKRYNYQNIVWENVQIIGKRRQYPWWKRFSNLKEPFQNRDWLDPEPEFPIPKWMKKVFGTWIEY